jgi:N-methylhydantoinase A
MAEGIRLVSVRRGVDPRRFALLAFGGAAGLHVTDLARQLDLARVVVPRVASVLSAWGMLATDMRFEVARTHIGDAGRLDGAGEGALRRDGSRGPRAAAASFADRCACNTPRRHALRRAGLRDQRAARRRRLERRPIRCRRSWRRFHRRHEALYTYAMRDQEAVLVNARVAAIGVLPALPQEPDVPARSAGAAIGERRIHLGGKLQSVKVYDLDTLAPGQEIAGPAIVESAMTTVLLRDGDLARTNEKGWLDITVPLRAS